MPQIIKDGVVVEDTWIHLSNEQIEQDGLPDSGDVIVPLSVWQAQKEVLLKRDGAVGVCLAPGEEPAAIAADLPRLSLVAVSFPAFKDGRGYSYARELRTRYGYKGEIRAVGDVLRDQLFYMHRVGFNAFAVRADRDIHDALNGLKDFSVTYQGDANDPRPIYRR
ncbi:MAG: DUF934 domain-containing protein [Alcanivorax sp.]|nr:DUF934 domain-containing protein [Alcanivorax sp.]